MKFLEVAAIGVAIVSQASFAIAKHSHQHDALHALHARRHHQHHGRDTPLQPISSMAEAGLTRSPEIKKRGGTCEFPSDAGLVAVTPDLDNGGWALSPDQPCKCGDYCPYACPPGEMMAQWDPKATSYTYPQSMNGGLKCNDDGTVSKPFPNKPYCMKGVGNVGVKDKTGKGCAVCQTVLPGNEAMLIPTAVEGWAEITVPGTDYWCETAAHFYMNPPGVSIEEGCVWGTAAKPWGNWSPYVIGANQDGTGNTFLKVGWNPKYTDGSAEFPIEPPGWGIEIECDGDGCNGLPCKIDPSVHKVNEISGDSSDGAGGASFCVVTVPEGVSANVVVSNAGGGGGDDSGSNYPTSSEKASSSSAPPPSTSSTPKPTTSAEPTTSSTPKPTTTSTPSSTSVASSSSSSPSSSSYSSSSASSSSAASSSSSSAYSSSSVSSSSYSSSSVAYSTTAKPSHYHISKPVHKTWSPHAFQQNYTASATGSAGSPSATNTGATLAPSGTSPIAGEPSAGAAGKMQIQAAGIALGSIALLAVIVL